MLRFVRVLNALLILGACGACLPLLAAPQKAKHPPLPDKLMRADSVAIDCDACPRELAKAGPTANEELLVWNRFRVVEDRRQADLIFLFSANPYLGDFLTRDGPDPRPVNIKGTILTVIDARTGQQLWSDSRLSGNFRVPSETKALIAELRTQMESQVRRWTLDEILRCNGAPAYEALASVTADEALSRPGLGVERMADAPNRLRVSSPDVPEFCRRAQLVVGPGDKLVGFEVVVPGSENLDVADLLEHADQFDFLSGRNGSQNVYFAARTKDRKILIQFDVHGREQTLSRVTYSY
jgi:hypothetical protein